MNIFAWIERALAFVAGAAVVLVLSSVYWNGIPFLNGDPKISLPIVGDVSLSDVPIFGNLAIGHLESEKRAAASAAVEGYVSRAEYLAERSRAKILQAQLTKFQEDQAAAEAAIARLTADEKEDADALDRAKSDAAGGTVWTDADIQRVRDYQERRRQGAPGTPR